ncbi:MAG: hypothetical protein J3K34DRAFT_230699 [Monoraphidium minutum]|nr:MAG: hypothetical protein J3K34DRAFT_230699 [Monoraphidium minutum]
MGALWSSTGVTSLGGTAVRGRAAPGSSQETTKWWVGGREHTAQGRPGAHRRGEARWEERRGCERACIGQPVGCRAGKEREDPQAPGGRARRPPAGTAMRARKVCARAGAHGRAGQGAPRRLRPAPLGRTGAAAATNGPDAAGGPDRRSVI